jgi:hypothetical protein
MSLEEFTEWSLRHAPEEVQQKVIELESQLRSELLESANVTLDEYQAASRDGQQVVQRC